MTRKALLVLFAALALLPTIATAQVVSARNPNGSRYTDDSQQQGFGLAAEADRLSREADEINRESDRLLKLGEKLKRLESERARAMAGYTEARKLYPGNIRYFSDNPNFRSIKRELDETIESWHRASTIADRKYREVKRSFDGQVSRLAQRFDDWKKDNEILRRRVREAAGSR